MSNRKGASSAFWLMLAASVGAGALGNEGRAASGVVIERTAPSPGPLASRASGRPSQQPPAIASLLKPKQYKSMMSDRDILTSASLDGKHYSYYAAMLVHAGMERTRRVLTDYALYSRLISYVDEAKYDPARQVLDIQGGIWKFKLRSSVKFEEQGDRWIHYRIVGGHFRGLEGDIHFESAGEKGTLVYMKGDQRGDHWPPKFVIERGAEIVFGFTAKRMRKYLESNEDGPTSPKTADSAAKSSSKATHPTTQGDPSRGANDSKTSDIPQPRSRL